MGSAATAVQRTSNAKILYSRAVTAKAAVDITMSGAAEYAWNSIQRDLYDKTIAAIQRQANALIAAGNISYEEAKQLVETQRNGLALSFRERLTPMGKFFSETLKPAASLKGLDQLIAEKGSIEAALKSVGKSRQAVNKIAYTMRIGGPALIIVDVTLTIVVIDQTPPGERGKVIFLNTAKLGGTLAVGRYGGLAGAWAGATTFAALASPTLVIPVIGEVSEAGCMVAGSMVGYFFGGLLGWGAGDIGGHALWRETRVFWKTK